MPFNPPPAIARVIRTAESRLAAQRNAVAERQRRLSEAARELKEATLQQELLERQVGHLRDLAIIERGLPPEVIALRERLAGETTEPVRAALVQACPHTFLYRQKRDHRNWDPEHQTVPGSMTCLACGYREEEVTPFCLDEGESYLVMEDGHHLCTRFLGRGVEYGLLPKPIPWETIRTFFISADLRQAAAAAGYRLQ